MKIEDIYKNVKESANSITKGLLFSGLLGIISSCGTSGGIQSNSSKDQAPGEQIVLDSNGGIENYKGEIYGDKVHYQVTDSSDVEKSKLIINGDFDRYSLVAITPKNGNDKKVSDSPLVYKINMHEPFPRKDEEVARRLAYPDTSSDNTVYTRIPNNDGSFQYNMKPSSGDLSRSQQAYIKDMFNSAQKNYNLLTDKIKTKADSVYKAQEGNADSVYNEQQGNLSD